IGYSMPHVFRIQRPRPVHVARPLDDRPAVGKDRELVSLGVELEQEAVVTDLAQGLEVTGHLLEVELSRRAGGGLDGIAAAQAGGLRALFTVEPLEAVALATRAIDLAQKRRNLDLFLHVLPDVEEDQVAVDAVAPAGQDLESLGGLVAGDDVDDRR